MSHRRSHFSGQKFPTFPWIGGNRDGTAEEGTTCSAMKTKRPPRDATLSVAELSLWKCSLQLGQVWSRAVFSGGLHRPLPPL